MYTRADVIKVNIYLTNPGSSNHTKLNEVLVQGSMPVQYHQSTTELDMPLKEYSHLKCLLLTSDQPFGVFVHLYDGNDFLSGFMALPVQAFGKVYMVITHLKRPFLIVMAQRKTKLFVSLSIDPVHELVVDGEIHPVGTHNWRTIQLESYQAFSLSKCLDESLYPNISLT
uniref:IgGFc-binding protein N-terminal domain-containing protein n=1 Tax=Biomphalaria glabrata TaxID=6526 RepID=A0A2C9KZ02_BIOGL